jgi:hypothetical protein
VLIIAAAAVAVLVSAIARWRGARRLGASLAGLGGPALVAAAYLVAGPGAQGSPQSQTYVAALIATAAGLAASTLVAIPGRRAAAKPRVRPAPAVEAALEGDVIEVVRTPTSAVASAGLGRPAWAAGSGPYAQAFTGAGAGAGAGTGAVHEPMTVVSRGTGWDADTLSGTGSASPGRHAQPREGTPGGLYRSSSTPDADADRIDPWLPDLHAASRPSGRHAATD